LAGGKACPSLRKNLKKKGKKSRIRERRTRGRGHLLISKNKARGKEKMLRHQAPSKRGNRRTATDGEKATCQQQRRGD